jgi:two-component system, OmpR family, sensor histidine kinase MprB
MNLRTRIGLAGGAVVLAALTVASGVIYPVLSSKARQQVDSSLLTAAVAAPDTIGQLKKKLADDPTPVFPDKPVDLGPSLLQIIANPAAPDAGAAFAPLGQGELDVAAGRRKGYFHDVVYRDQHYRVYTTLAGPEGPLIRVAQATEDATLTRLWLLLVGLTVGGSLAATAAARLAAGQVLQPVRRLTAAVEHVTATRDLTASVPAGGRDEIGRLARSFTVMMRALDESVTAQRRLVADASHELRTPLTSLTTNLELLDERAGATDPLAPELVHAARDQARELTDLVNDVVDLARYGEGETHTEDARLDLLAERVVRRAADRARGAVRFELRTAETLVHADPDAIERAIANLVDNAVKWSPPGGRVVVSVAAGGVAVADEGPGIPPADLPYVFDRFYRSPAARALPGSGLGLAIVRQIAETYGGRVSAEPRPTGTLIRLYLPTAPAVPPPRDGWLPRDPYAVAGPARPSRPGPGPTG